MLICFLYMMTTNDFYQQLDRNKPLIQGLATKLVNDFDTARFLYHETAHQAIQNKNKLQQDTFEEWLMNTMNKVYLKWRQGIS